MTKVISLSEKAYGTLRKLKRSDESFSDVVLRMAGEKERKSLLSFAGTWKGDDIEEVFSIVMKDRERASSRGIRQPQKIQTTKKDSQF
jgi:predicted CopG family antitoxin